jgi:F-type H+-transporting ATPase subunit delta
MATSAAIPYATALLELASEQGTINAIRQQLNRLVEVLAASKELRVAFSNPTLTTAERLAVVRALVGPLGLSRTCQNFLFVLAEKGRLAVLDDIVQVFSTLADERTGVVRTEVVSSVPVTEGQLMRLKAALGKMTGKTVKLETRVDPDLIGGLQIHVDGTVYDTSIATQLQKLRETILSSP